MKKVALVFVLAVFVPSLVLAWLAVRSLRDQQFLLERQESLLYQGVADLTASQLADAVAEYQHSFSMKVAALVRGHNPRDVCGTFDELLRKDWPLAQVGFAVTLNGDILAPSPYGRPEARTFCADNGRFLANREAVEVYWNSKTLANAPAPNAPPPVPEAQNAVPEPSLNSTGMLNTGSAANSSLAQNEFNSWGRRGNANASKVETRNVSPKYQSRSGQNFLPFENNGAGQGQGAGQQVNASAAASEDAQFSKVSVSEAEFRQLIGEDSEGTLARFVDNKLNVLFWCRAPNDPELIFGAQLSLARLVESLRPLVQPAEPALRDEICLALLDDLAKPAALSQPGFRAAWKHPLVATELGEVLPHWEVAIYLLDPAKLTRSAQTVKLTLGLLIALLVLAIGTGSWLIVADLNRQLTLARQKTDFVSNVSHELKTPLTSIRMFSELLAEGRVREPAKQRSYLNIITAETARLTRLINNVLDFARLERGEKKYHFQICDGVELARETAETYRPHLEANGFRFECELPAEAGAVCADRDALAQVLVNLFSNAEKYSDSRKEITLRVSQQTAPLPHLEFRVLDRGLGVPPGCEARIFEKFYRAHDSLSSGIQGSGLGLTLARQIARAHGGEVTYEPREGGGSCFVLSLPLAKNEGPQCKPKS